jgi:diguanylate cyclase (GGDEF)-like protein
MTHDEDDSLDLKTDPYLESISGPTFSEQLKLERIKILYDRFWLGQLGILVCSSLLYFGLIYISNIPFLKYWYMAILITAAIRILTFAVYKFYPNRPTLSLALYLAGVIVNGLIWAIMTSILIPQNDYPGQMVIIIVTAGLCSGALQTTQSSLIATLISSSLLILPLCFWLFFQNTLAHNILGLAMATYYLLTLVLVYRGHALLTDALTLKFFNYDLVKNLSNTNISLRQTYLTQKHHEQDMSNIIKMNARLQICKTSQEAYDTIKLTAISVFKDLNGSLTVSDSKDFQRVVAEWGKIPRLHEQFSSNQCWALRSGSQFDYKEHGDDILCNHYIKPPIGNTMCVPLTAQNDNIGMLNINIPKEATLSKHLYQVIAVFADTITLALSNIKLQEKLQNEATHDPLTNLVNRRYLMEALDRELISVFRNKRTLCVAMLDIDFFKLFNDTAGHDAGDEVLKHMAKILIHRTRGNDIACRFGGEEFILVFEDTTIEKVMPRLKQICEEIKSENIYFQNTLLKKISVSVGLAESPSHGQTVEDIIHAADKALYEAKNTGRNKIVIANKLTNTPL